MKQIFNEFWISLVLWNWNWIWFSYEIEKWENEIRWFWWKKIKFSEIKDIYFRFRILKNVFVFSKKNWFKIKKKNKIWLKIIFWISN